jgi:DNA repair protein RadD
MLSLRPYQQIFIERLRAAMHHRRVLGVSPTGSGKTVVFTHIAATAAARGRKVLILVHRRELLQQTISRLLEDGLQVSEHGNLWVSTIGRQTTFKPDLLIVDEAHHATSPTWRKRIDEHDCPTLGFTATPERLDGRGLGDVFNVMVIGPTVAELMRIGALSRYKIFAPPPPSTKGIRIVAGDFQRSGLSALIDTPKVAYDALRNWQRHAAGRRTIAFGVSVAHAAHIAQSFQAAGVSAESVDGTMAIGERAAVIERFRSGVTTVLVSCELVSEGLDVPECDAILLLRPTKSLGLYLQQVGRGLRPSGQPCIILDCVGSVGIHGCPDDDRDWSLDGRTKKSTVTGPAIRTCPSCFGVHRPAPSCPYCFHVYVVAPVVPASVAADLVAVDPSIVRAVRRAEVARARSREDLERIAQDRGYKPGWVTVQLAMRER